MHSVASLITFLPHHVEQVLNKMCTACYALRNIKHIVPIDTLRVIYFAHIHSIISYSIIFLGSSCYANKIFIFQKIIRIITNTRPRDSCREVFKSTEILTLYFHYIYSLVLYTINNKHLFDSVQARRNKFLYFIVSSFYCVIIHKRVKSALNVSCYYRE